ncbi:MAG: gliding motility-associated C-terminal domain-containing protein [Bacteroidales bacterium]|nr:gliding motility-associated C-terminal domain-containing protein [Bacteroidales bacterium]
MQPIAKQIILLLVLIVGASISLQAQGRIIVRYDTICPGETGCHTYMDTLFYEDWESSNSSCWQLDKNGSNYIDGFSISNKLQAVQIPSYQFPAYDGNALFEASDKIYNLYGYITDDDIPSSITAYWSNAMLTYFTSTATSPSFTISDPSQTTVSFFFYDEILGYETMAFDDEGYPTSNPYEVFWYYDLLNVIDQVALYGSTNTKKIWGLSAEDIDREHENINNYDTWKKATVSMSSLSAGDNTLKFYHINQGGIGFGVDNILVYGPRCIKIPTAVSALPSGSTYENSETVYRHGCQPTTITTHWYVKGSKKDTVAITTTESGYQWNGTTYTTSGIYNKSGFTDNDGCDSTAYLNLTISKNARVVLPPITVCDEYTWTDGTGKTYTSTTTDSVVCTECTSSGSDSTTILTINIHKSYPDMKVYKSLCEDAADMDSAFVDYDTTTQRLTTMAGTCDSIVTTYTTIHPSYKFYDTLELCNHEGMTVPWRHTVLTQDLHDGGDYTLEAATSNECDSNFYLHLKLTHAVTSSVSDTIIENDLPYIYDGQSYPAAVSNISHTLQSVNGCDSIISFSLVVIPNVTADIYDTVCYSQLPHTWNGKTFYASSLSAGPLGGDIAQQTTLFTTRGADSTITMHLHVNAIYDIHQYEEICANRTYQFAGQTYTFAPSDDKNVRYNDTLKTVQGGCDSMVSLHLHVWPTYEHEQYDTTTTDLLPYRFGPYQCNEIGDYHYTEQSVHKCDSLLTLHLWVIQITHFDTAVCSNRTPFIWHNRSFKESSTDTVTLTGIHGEDSLLLLHAIILDTSAFIDQQERCDRYVWLNGITYTESTSSPRLMRTNRYGCDSVVHLDLIIDKSTAIADHISACNTYTWMDGITYESSIYGPQVMLHTVHGCDSLVTLDLYIAYSTYEEILDTLCSGSQYDFRGHMFSRGGIYVDSLLTVEKCDSITLLNLIELTSPHIETELVRDCEANRYYINVITEADYVEWNSYPKNLALDEQKHSKSIILNPHVDAEYTVYADYQSYPVCPAAITFSLSPLQNPKATLHSTPDFISYDNNILKATDVSGDYDTRNWYIDGLMQDSHEEKFSYTCDMANDSVVVMLEVVSGLCRDTAYTTLHIYKPTLYMPSAFTPFLSSNNTFKPQGVGIVNYSLQIYNRQGLLVFSTKDFDEAWNGKYKDTYCEQGVYVYLIRYTDITAPESYKEVSGNIMLLR